MRKLVPVIAAVLGVAALAGCASMYKSLGIATTSDIAAHSEALAAKGADIDARASEIQTLTARIDALEAAAAELKATNEGLAAGQARIDGVEEGIGRIDSTIEAVQAKIDEIQGGLDTLTASVEDFSRVSQAVDELRAQVENLPNETLKRLVDILSQAIEASAPY